MTLFHVSQVRLYIVSLTIIGLLYNVILYFVLSNEQKPAEHLKQGECSCFRPKLPQLTTFNATVNRSGTHSSLCSDYATRRGPHQRIISISLFGPKENKIFQYNRSLTFLKQLIKDVNLIYPDDFILRIYHDNTINPSDVICPTECENANVDFCQITNLYIPPKIWRFIPAGDPLVDISKYLLDRY